MGEYDLQEKNPCCVGFAKLILIATNLVFLAVGAGTIYSGIWLNHSGWEDVLGDEYPWAKNATMWFVIGFGILIVLISLAGCCGAASRSKGLLQCYNGFLVLSVIIFVVLAAASFFMMDVAGNWENKAYPAETKEVTVGADFNRVYCLAESAYACSDIPAEQAVTQFFGPVEGHKVAELIGENNKATLDVLCEDQKYSAGNLSVACNWCEITETGIPYNGVYEWANENNDCKLTPESASWCAAQIKSQEKNSFGQYAGTPYEKCRTDFLHEWRGLSMYFGISTLVCAVLLIILIVFSCSLFKRKRHQESDGEKQPLVGSTLSYSN